jgi:hypothetical protein
MFCFLAAVWNNEPARLPPVLAGLAAAALLACSTSCLPAWIRPVAQYLRRALRSGMETFSNGPTARCISLPCTFRSWPCDRDRCRSGCRPPPSLGLAVVAWFAAPFISTWRREASLDPTSAVRPTGDDPGRSGWAVSRIHHRLAAGVAVVAIWAAIMTSAAVTYHMLVDHTVEHPWEPKTVLGFALPNLVEARVQGVFGFPYRRGLEKVGELFRSGELAGTFESNERNLTVEYYCGAKRSSPPGVSFDDPGSVAPDYYIYVHRPFSLRRELPETVRMTYRWIGAIEERGRTTVDIYAAPWIPP